MIPAIGYEKSVAVAKEALLTGLSGYELTLEKGWLSREALDEILSPEHMTHPRQVSGTQQNSRDWMEPHPVPDGMKGKAV